MLDISCNSKRDGRSRGCVRAGALAGARAPLAAVCQFGGGLSVGAFRTRAFPWRGVPRGVI